MAIIGVIAVEVEFINPWPWKKKFIGIVGYMNLLRLETNIVAYLACIK